MALPDVYKQARLAKAIRHLQLAGELLDPLVDRDDDLAYDLREPLESITDAYFCLLKLSGKEEAPP